MKQMDEADIISKQRLHWKHGNNNNNKPLPAAAGAGNELHQSSIFVTLILEHTFKWRSLKSAKLVIGLQHLQLLVGDIRTIGFMP